MDDKITKFYLHQDFYVYELDTFKSEAWKDLFLARMPEPGDLIIINTQFEVYSGPKLTDYENGHFYIQPSKLECLSFLEDRIDKLHIILKSYTNNLSLNFKLHAGNLGVNIQDDYSMYKDYSMSQLREECSQSDNKDDIKGTIALYHASKNALKVTHKVEETMQSIADMCKDAPNVLQPSPDPPMVWVQANDEEVDDVDKLFSETMEQSRAIHRDITEVHSKISNVINNAINAKRYNRHRLYLLQNILKL